MRQTCLNLVHELARADERVVFIGSDLGAGTLARFRGEFPDRFIMEGVNEANIVGMAAGLALEGRIVYVNTLAVFLTRRVFEQLALDVCLHRLNVRLIGNGGGMVYAPLGPTHMATDDMALMRTLPHMAIVAPCDAREMEQMMPLVHRYNGPAYIRLAKGGDPVVCVPGEPRALGQPVRVRDGADALLLTTGITLGMARAAADILARGGIEAGIIHCPTVKPLDKAVLLEAMAAVPSVLTVEEHIATGGLGSAVAEMVAEMESHRPHRMTRMALPDLFPDHYGSQADLLRHYGLTAENIAAVVRQKGGPYGTAR